MDRIQTRGIAFLGGRIFVRNLKKLDSLGISRERVEKNQGIAFFGILSRTGQKKSRKIAFF